MINDSGIDISSEDALLSTARWTVLSRRPGMTPSVLAKLFHQYRASEAIFDNVVLSTLGFKESEIVHVRSEIARVREELIRYEAQGIRAVPIDSSFYPGSLLDLRVPPVVVYTSGELLPEDSRAVAIVGTRTPSLAGRRMAREIARRAVAAGFSVVSGLARGIDTEAHRSALLAGGRTIAVLGNGLTRLYPPENQSLAHRIRRRGALVSELWPEAPVSRLNLLARDRLQSAFSLAVIVVQTHLGCGSLTTARYAIACRRPLFAVKWDEEPFTIGLARLRHIGATIIEEDDLDEVFSAANANPQPRLY